MKSTNPSINTVLILGAGELGLPVLRAMSRQARLSPSLKISVLLRPEAARAVSGPPGRGGMRWRGSASPWWKAICSKTAWRR